MQSKCIPSPANTTRSRSTWPTRTRPSSPNGSQPAQPEGSSAPALAQELVGAELTPEALTATELTLEERSLLVEQALALIDNFYVHLPLKLPCNDAALSFGQVAEYAARGAEAKIDG